MPKFQDITGRQYGLLTILGRAPNNGEIVRWRYRCACGREGVTGNNHFKTNPTANCGCIRSARTRERSTTHGHTVGETPSSTYQIWRTMLQRTQQPKSKYYPYYGGRGITVCERWFDFKNFLADMGERPDGLTLERRQVNGHYEPSNCEWATRQAQSNNVRDQSKWLVDGQLMTQAQVARHWACDRDAARRRLARIPLHSGRMPKWHHNYIPERTQDA